MLVKGVSQDCIINDVARQFGVDKLYPEQADAVKSFLNGQDVFFCQRTGYGKSIVFQVASQLLPGVTIVVSPLKSLINDQIKHLNDIGVPAGYIHSELTAAQMRKEYRKLQQGKAKLFYVTPERLQTSSFFKEMSGVEVSLVAADEAHCVSTWGNDFRPTYLAIPRAAARLGCSLKGAFTATAPKKIREDVINILEMSACSLWSGDPSRENLNFQVLKVKTLDKKLETLIELLNEDRTGSTIIYSSTVANTELIGSYLKEQGLAPLVYHGRLTDIERRVVEREFAQDSGAVMVATKAFGMGVHNDLVDRTIHFDLPASLEDYYQEAGRAGRRGQESDCILFYSPYDRSAIDFFIESSNPNLAMIRGQYNRLVSFLMPTELNKEVPAASLWIKHFVEGAAPDHPMIQQKILASLGILQRAGLIALEGREVLFTHPIVKSDSDTFPVSQEMLDKKRFQDEVRLKTMIYYASSGIKHSKLIHSYFSGVDLDAQISAYDFDELALQEDTNFQTMVKALSRKDLFANQLGYLTGTNSRVKGQDHACLSNLSMSEVKSLVRLGEQQGFIAREVRTNRRSFYYRLTSKAFDKFGIDINEVSAAEVLTNIKSANVRLLLQKTFQEWMNKKQLDLSDYNSIRQSLLEFREMWFNIRKEILLGREIVAAYVKKNPNDILSVDVKEFLIYVFADSLTADSLSKTKLEIKKEEDDDRPDPLGDYLPEDEFFIDLENERL